MQDDELLFREDESQQNETPKSSRRLSAQELRHFGDMFFREKVLNFGFGSIFFILLLALFLIRADFYAQSKGYNSDMIKECLSLLTYIATAALGYIFGSNSK